jgi:hypothetical protein
MNTNETNAELTRRQFLGKSAAAGMFAMGYKADNWISIKTAGGLQSALDALPNEGGTIHIPTGTYNFNKPVTKTLQEGQHLFIVGDGRGSVLNNISKSGEPLLQITGVTGAKWPDMRITIRDIAFVGNHQSGDALIVVWPNDTLIDTCFFLGHGGHAISLVPYGTNITIRDCWIRDCKRGIHAEAIHHITLHGNQTRSLDGGQEQEEHVYIGWDSREIRIVNNHFAYGFKTAIILDGTAQHVISNNTIEGFNTAIEAHGVSDKNYRDHCRDIAISSNYLKADIGVHLVGECRGFAITGNEFIDNAVAAILIEEAKGAGKHTITGNVVRKSVYGGAFFPYSQMISTNQGGFRLGEAEDCVVSGNILDAIDPGPAICAGPGGGRHIITSNRIIQPTGTALDITAEGCLIEHNLST